MASYRSGRECRGWRCYYANRLLSEAAKKHEKERIGGHARAEAHEAVEKRAIIFPKQ